MGSYMAYCNTKTKQIAHDIKKECKGSNESTTVRTSFQTLADVDPENFHAHQGDFVTQKPSEFLFDYDLQEEIGSGSFGRVFRSIDKRTNQPRAIKYVSKSYVSKKNGVRSTNEVRLLSHLDHPNIVKIYEVLEDERYYYIVGELLTGGELFDRIAQNKHFTEQEAAKIMWQVLAAVAYCHRFDVVHKDLKPENILFDTMFDDTIKIIDFGLAQAFQPEQRMHDVSGTAYYMAPEVLTGDYTEKCDVWSCGVILYVMLSGFVPFKGATCKEIYKKVQGGSFNFNHPVWETTSTSAKRLIKKMLKYNPEKRVSAQKALGDPWFQQFLKKSPVNKSNAEEALRRLRDFRVSTKLQEAVWVFLVSYFSSKSDINRLAETFRVLDQDNDGQLAKKELKQAYMKIMDMSNVAANEAAEKILQTLDSNNDGKIDYSEFISATISRNTLLTKEKLETVFRMIDANKDGKITAEELKLLFNDEKIQKLPKDVWKRWIQQADMDKNGALTFEQFKKMMLSLYEK